MTIKKSTKSSAAADNYQPTHPDHFRVKYGNSGNYTSRLVATKDYPANSEIIKLDAKTLVSVPDPVYTTVQTGEKSHVELNCDLTFMNHSCNPNVHINTHTWELTAARDIAAGDEMTFFYPSTEWHMDQPFDCWCGSEKCIGKVCGAKDAPKDILSLNYLNDHIIQMLSQHEANKHETVGDLISF
ncbi:hypothetical protein BDF19DRAFT_456114 [Syncephalis fuscata]|nr:hypothetical protein BDF19DRAFT_456114 [Syncephalis fuscata]